MELRATGKRDPKAPARIGSEVRDVAHVIEGHTQEASARVEQQHALVCAIVYRHLPRHRQHRRTGGSD